MGIVFGVDGGVNVLEAVRSAIHSASHLEATDGGAVANALAIAGRIQESLDSEEVDRRDKVMYGPISSLEKILTDLGLTPQGRMNLGLIEDAPPDDDEF